MSTQKQSKPARPRLALAEMLTLLLAVTTPLMLWKTFCLLSNSSKPIMCVVSESMAPAFHRGDVLFLWNRTSIIHAGDIPVVWFAGHPMPMVHRAAKVWYEEGSHEADVHALRLLTKGDNNALSDESLYPVGRTSATGEEVVGLVAAYVPFLGWAAIAFQETAWMKYVLIGIVLVVFAS